MTKPQDLMPKTWAAAMRIVQERDAALGVIDSILEAIKGDRFKDALGHTAEWYVGYVLGTAGHSYHVQGFVDVCHERDEALEALRAMRNVTFSSNAQEIYAAHEKAQAVLSQYEAATPQESGSSHDAHTGEPNVAP